jgi:uncharacterized membrane protein YhaH (DUF805 family)
MSPIDYALTPLRKYADIHGRARRSEYWWFVLFIMVVGFAVGLIEGVLGLAGSVVGPYGFLTLLFYLAIILPSITVGVRRLHDTGRSGWWLLIGLVPVIGGIVLLVFYVLDSDRGDNAYGPDPKGGERGGAYAG